MPLLPTAQLPQPSPFLGERWLLVPFLSNVECGWWASVLKSPLFGAGLLAASPPRWEMAPAGWALALLPNAHLVEVLGCDQV